MVLNGVEPDIEMEFDDDYGYITSFRIKSPQYFLDNQLRLKFNPIECVAGNVRKLNFGHLRPAKIQLSLCLCAV